MQFNNDLAKKNQTFKANMISLNKLALVEATLDTIVYPYQSEQFGGYVWGTQASDAHASLFHIFSVAQQS